MKHRFKRKTLSLALAQFEFQLDANLTTRRRLVDLTALLREYGELA